MKYKVLLVTVTYLPDMTMLQQCLDSIMKYNDIGDSLKIVVVDNSPIDKSIIPCLKNKYRHVEFIPAPENKGFGYSNNLGIEAFESDNILIFNNDTELIEPVFKRLIKFMEDNPTTGCIGIKQAYKYPSFFKRPESNISYLKMKWEIAKDKYNNKNYFIPGAFMFVRRSTFYEAGKFDENIFMYYEDPDLCNRILNTGYHINYIPQLMFYHKTGERHSFSEQMYKISLKSYIYYMKKFGYENFIKKDLKKNILFMRLKGILFYLFFKKKIANQLFKGSKIHKDFLQEYLNHKF